MRRWPILSSEIDHDTLVAMFIEHAILAPLARLQRKIDALGIDTNTPQAKTLFRQKSELRETLRRTMVQERMTSFACETAKVRLSDGPMPSKAEVDFLARKSPSQRRYTRKCTVQGSVRVTYA